MWIASSLGYFSIVTDNKTHGRRQKWLVRARRERDLHNLIKAVPALCGGPVIASPRADYCARLRVGKRQLGAIMRKLVQTIDYPNFKSSIHDNPDQADKSNAYMSCWHAMFDYQNQRSYRGYGQRALPSSAELSFDELDAMAETPTKTSLKIA